MPGFFPGIWMDVICHGDTKICGLRHVCITVFFTLTNHVRACLFHDKLPFLSDHKRLTEATRENMRIWAGTTPVFDSRSKTPCVCPGSGILNQFFRCETDLCDHRGHVVWNILHYLCGNIRNARLFPLPSGT